MVGCEIVPCSSPCSSRAHQNSRGYSVELTYPRMSVLCNDGRGRCHRECSNSNYRDRLYVTPAVEIVQKQKGIDPAKVFLMGASEGTLLAAEAAARAPNNLEIIQPRSEGVLLTGGTGCRVLSRARHRNLQSLNVVCASQFVPLDLAFECHRNGLATDVQVARIG